MTIPPVLILVFIWLLIILPLSKLNRIAKKQQTAAKAKATAGAKKPAASPEAGPAQPRTEASARPAVLEPTITFTEHDDSVYQGSMNAVTGEGYDPCHDEQLAPLSGAEREILPAPAEEIPGLLLSWTGNEVVRGIVMSEILTRRGSAR